MKRMIIVPDGWPCLYHECRPGFFVVNESLYLKSEYGGEGYCDTGEYFAKTDCMVQPVNSVWEEFESD